MKHSALLLAFLVLAPAACQVQGSRRTAVAPPRVAPTLEGVDCAYEAATRQVLPELVPTEYPGLHNVYHLSEDIHSGSEPHDEAALEELASWGIRTIVSVDGKVPDVEVAERLGMRYVHIPIQYRGITEEEMLGIAKTFRELEAPFYVHCFHGKHRGPAAAAVGRLVRDGAPREQVLAEMRQWCGTSEKYEGLYRVIALGDVPEAEETEAHEFDFPASRQMEGLRGAMVMFARHWDNLKAVHENEWGVDPTHPDLNPLEEARVLGELFGQALELEDLAHEPADLQTWMKQGKMGADDLVAALSERSGDPVGVGEWHAKAEAAYALVSGSCSDCHGAYRND